MINPYPLRLPRGDHTNFRAPCLQMSGRKADQAVFEQAHGVEGFMGVGVDQIILIVEAMVEGADRFGGTDFAQGSGSAAACPLVFTKTQHLDQHINRQITTLGQRVGGDLAHHATFIAQLGGQLAQIRCALERKALG